MTRAQVYACLAHYEDQRGEIDFLVAQQLSPTSDKVVPRLALYSDRELPRRSQRAKALA